MVDQKKAAFVGKKNQNEQLRKEVIILQRRKSILVSQNKRALIVFLMLATEKKISWHINNVLTLILILNL